MEEIFLLADREREREIPALRSDDFLRGNEIHPGHCFEFCKRFFFFICGGSLLYLNIF